MKHQSLLKDVDAYQAQHLQFDEGLANVRGRIDQALGGSEAKFQAISGPSRFGKTALLKALKSCYRETKIGGKRQVRVLFVNSLDAPSPKVLPRSVLHALGVPIPRKQISVGELTDFMHEQLDLVDNQVLVFDEFSQLLEAGSRVSAEEVARWCKTVILRGRTVVAAGVPRIERLLDADVQLVGRAYRTIRFHPYRPDVPSEIEAYASVGVAYLELFAARGWVVAEEDQRDVEINIYLHAPGLVGGVCDLMRQLARQLQGKPPRRLSLEDFAAAASTLEPLGPGFPAPFTQRDLTLSDLNKAYLHVVARNAAPKRKEWI